MNGRRDRESRREAGSREAVGEAAARRQYLIKLGSASAFLAIVAVAVLIVISAGQSNGGDTSLEGVSQVKRALGGVPQNGMTLGRPDAKVTLVEFADLQCPVCKGYAEDVLPSLIEGQVAAGEAKIEFRSFPILGPQSVTAAAAAIAAGEQGRGWSFVELFYRNQGIEGSDYVTDSFLTAVAEGAGVPDIARWNRDRRSQRVVDEVTKTTGEAEDLGFTGTPSFAIEGPATNGLETLGTPGGAGPLESAISAAS